MNEHDIGVFQQALQPGRILCVYIFIMPEQQVGDIDAVTLKRVVHELGALEEVGVSGDRFPRGVYAQFMLQRDDPVKNLGDPASRPGGVDVNDVHAVEEPRQLPQLVDDLGSHDPLVLLKESGHHSPPCGA